MCVYSYRSHTMLFQIEMFLNDWMRLKCHFPNAGIVVWSSALWQCLIDVGYEPLFCLLLEILLMMWMIIIQWRAKCGRIDMLSIYFLFVHFWRASDSFIARFYYYNVICSIHALWMFVHTFIKPYITFILFFYLSFKWQKYKIYLFVLINTETDRK